MATITTNTVRTYKDLDLNFISHPVRKDVNKLLDEDAVIGSIRNLLQTSHYERLFQPSLGSNVKRILFENMDPISESALKREIIQTLTNFEPRVSVNSITIKSNYENNSYDLSLNFTVLNTSEQVSIQFSLKRDR
jgi:phage baseplate assembly protein W